MEYGLGKFQNKVKPIKQKMRLKNILLLTALSINIFLAPAQKNTEKQISDSLTVIANSYAALGRINIAGIEVNQKDKTVTVLAGDVLSQIPFRKENVQQTLY
jgi:hypothetical protein